MFISIVLGILYSMVVDFIAKKIFVLKNNKGQKFIIEEKQIR